MFLCRELIRLKSKRLFGMKDLNAERGGEKWALLYSLGQLLQGRHKAEA